LFAVQGPNATSLRQVIAKAKVNLAAIHYHFGSKESLMQAVLSRRLVPLNAERLALLETYEHKSGKGAVSLPKVLEALVGPALRLSRDPKRGGTIFMRLLGRCVLEPDKTIQTMLNHQFHYVLERFTPALQRALPDLPPVDFFWRIHFLVGSMAHTMADSERLRSISGGVCDPDDTEGTIRRLVTFLNAGLKARVDAP
jgi:AcrR family transcriptional regulator